MSTIHHTFVEYSKSLSTACSTASAGAAAVLVLLELRLEMGVRFGPMIVETVRSTTP